MKLILLPSALTDLETIYHFYIITYNENIARQIFRDIYQKVKLLEKFPLLGIREPISANPHNPYRSLIVSKGRVKIIYYIKNDIIYIAFIWDCRQNPKKLIHKIR